MVSPKTAQKPCTTDAQILHPTSCLHGDNRFASSESSPLSFLVKLRADPEPRGVVLNLLLNLSVYLDLGSSSG